MEKPNKAKVIKKKETGLKAVFGGRPWVLGALLFLILLLFAMAMPMANIPGFSFLAGFFGITPDSMRTLTLSDMLARAMGMDGGRVANAQYAGGYNSAYDFRGGLSAITRPGGSRLFDAQEAYRKEYELHGKYKPVKGALGSNGSGVYNPNGSYEGVDLGALPAGAIPGDVPIIDGERVGPGGEYGPGYGAPLAGAAGEGGGTRAISTTMLGTVDRNMVKPVNPHNIAGAGRNTRAEETVNDLARSLRAGRLGKIGGANAMTRRAGASAGSMGAFGSFGDVGRSYFFSWQANMSKYKTAAKHLAEAAFDGGEAEDVVLLVPGEVALQGTANQNLNPNTIANKLRTSKAQCSAAKAGIEQIYDDSSKLKKRIADLNKMDIPNSCPEKKWVDLKITLYTFVPFMQWLAVLTGWDLKPSKTAVGERNAWNTELANIKQDCEALKSKIESASGKCGINYTPNPPGKKECKDIMDLKIKGPKNKGEYYKWVKICKNIHLKESNGKELESSEVETTTDEIREAVSDFGDMSISFKD